MNGCKINNNLQLWIKIGLVVNAAAAHICKSLAKSKAPGAGKRAREEPSGALRASECAKWHVLMH